MSIDMKFPIVSAEDLTLLHSLSPSRRNPRLQRGMRPASFPGPMGPLKLGESLDSATGSTALSNQRRSMLKPPRQPSLVSDDDVMAMDGTTYRHLMQDLTAFKTMLFKLKRVIQEVSHKIIKSRHTVNPLVYDHPTGPRKTVVHQRYMNGQCPELQLWQRRGLFDTSTMETLIFASYINVQYRY